MGIKFSISPQLYYKWRLNSNLSVAPNAGIMYEHSAKDIDNGFLADMSGGNLVMGTIGAEGSFQNLSSDSVGRSRYRKTWQRVR